MVRPALVSTLVRAFVLLLGLGLGTGHASGVRRVMGMYPTAASTTPLPMLDSDVVVSVRGPIVETIVTQKFHNRSDRAIEATYIFPLPADAAVSAMWITTGTRTIRAAIEKREDAQRRYEAAVRAGVTAAVLDQERPDVFTQTVSAIPARGTVEVTLRYDTVARYADGAWTLVLPMVVGPRYVPGTASGRPTTGTGRAPDTDRAPDASRITPTSGHLAGGATAVAITFAAPVTDLTSPTHELVTTQAATTATFTDPHSDHDAVIRWRAPTPAAGWVEAAPGGGFAAVVVEAAPVAPRTRPMRAVLVVDRAATMKGDATVVAQPLVRALLGALGPADRIAATTGHDQPAWAAPALALRTIEQAWTRRTAPFDLTRVLAATRPAGAPLVLISDGLVADDPAVIAAAKKLRVPIHVIGVGASPARGLLTQIAAVSGGTIRFVLPGDDLVAAATAVLVDAGSAPAPLTVTWGTLTALDVVPALLPRLGAGQAMVVLARVKRAQSANARARGELFAIEEHAPSRRPDGATTAAGPLARRWARMRLDDLLTGSPDRSVVTAHALAFGLVSPYTSLVAIGDEVVVKGGVKHSIAVPVSVPAGMDWNLVKEETTVDTTTLAEPIATSDVRQNTKAPTRKAEDLDRGGEDAGIRADAADEEEDDADDAMRGPAPEPGVASAQPMSEAYETVALVSGTASYRRALRIATSLGGGLALQDRGDAGVVTLGARLELGRRTLVGAEAALWLVGGDDVQGRVLLSVARRGVARWFELGAGAGVHLGAGTGPAGALTLRVPLPPRPELAGYLRYDAALLFQRDETRQGQHTLTLGLEWGF